MPLSPLLSGYDNVLLDLDGCVWVGDTPTRGAREAVAELRAAGKGLAFVTNDSRRSPEEYVRKLWSLGLRASTSRSTPGTTAHHRSVYSPTQTDARGNLRRSSASARRSSISSTSAAPA